MNLTINMERAIDMTLTMNTERAIDALTTNTEGAILTTDTEGAIASYIWPQDSRGRLAAGEASKCNCCS
jgi:hypothetical protein